MIRALCALSLVACSTAHTMDAGNDAATEPIDASLPNHDGGWGGHEVLTWEALNVAHGGGALERPQHTLLAYQHALDVGADVLGLDLHRTSDGVIVVLGGVDGAVASMTLAEVQALDAGDDFGPDEGFPYRGMGLTVPTLEEVFDAFPDARFFIEMQDFDERLDRAVVDIIVARSMQNRVVITAFLDPPYARALEPSIPTWMSPVEMENLKMLRPADEATYVAPAPLVAPPFRSTLFDRDLITKVQRFGLFLMVWTVSDEAEMEAAIDLGVRGIITDRPTLLEQVFVRRGLRP